MSMQNNHGQMNPALLAPKTWQEYSENPNIILDQHQSLKQILFATFNQVRRSQAIY
jgi:hypothetical protein